MRIRRRRARREPREALRRRLESLAPPRKVEAQPFPAGGRVGIEAGARHRGHAHPGDQVARERHVVPEAEAGNVGHHVIGPARGKGSEAGGLERRHQIVSPFPVAIGKLIVVGHRQLQGRGRRFLQGRRRPHGQEVVNLSDCVAEARRPKAPADAPAGDAVGLGHPADGHRPLPHPFEAGKAHVPRAVVNDVLVDLVGHRNDIPLPAQRGNLFEFAAGKHLPRGVVGSIDDDRLGPVPEGALELGRVVGPVGLAQPHEARARAAQDGVGAVVLVERLEHDDLLAGIDQGEQGRGHALGGAAAHRDLGLRVVVEPAEAPRLADQGLAQSLRSPGDGVLVDVGLERPGGLVLDRRRRREVREALGEVDAVVFQAQPGHLADHRLGEPGAALGHRVTHGPSIVSAAESPARQAFCTARGRGAGAAIPGPGRH